MGTEGASRQTPPRLVQSIAAGTTAALLAVGGNSVKSAYITMQAVGGDAQVLFGDSSVGSAAGTAGWLIPDGTAASWYITARCNYVSTAGAEVRWHVSA